MSNYNQLRITYGSGVQDVITLTADTIPANAYDWSNIVAVEVPEIVTEIGGYAFCDNYELASITLNEGLTTINGQAFQHGVYSAVTIPSTVTFIGMNAFNIAEEQGVVAGELYITCLAETPPSLEDGEGITFGNPDYLTIYVPSGSVEDYKTDWYQYANIIYAQGEGPVPPTQGFTQLDVVSAFVGNVEVIKMYLGEDVIWEAPTDPCEGLSGQSLCECQGGYWWDDSCHDYPEPLKVKLTFDFPNTGEVKLYEIDLDIDKIEIDGEEIEPEQYYYYDPAVSAGTHEVLYSYRENEYYAEYVIPPYAFYNLPNLVAIEVFGVPGRTVAIRDYAFSNYNTPSNVTAITLHEGIWYLGPRAFEEIRNVTAITIPSSVQFIDADCFHNFGEDNPIHYTFLGTTPPTLSFDYADLGNRDNMYINVPCEALNDYRQAWGYLESRIYCGDFMKLVPLTFEITNLGTAATPGIGLRISGDTSGGNRRQLSYYWTHEGVTTQGRLSLSEAESNSARTSMITGLSVGDTIEFWGYTDQSGMSVSLSAFEYFVTSAGLTARVYGNVNSLLFSGAFYHGQPVPQTAETAPYAFLRLFTGKAGFDFGTPDDFQHIVLPVPANGLTDSIYREMFYGCTGLVKAPVLPSLYMPDNCYRSMFNGCTGLTEAPELPATGVGQYACLSMFADCTSLTEAPELPITTMASSCYSNMFRGCTSLTDMPELPATTLASSCYTGMFSACTSLTGVTDLPATVMQEGCYAYMFARCTSLTEAPEFGGDAEQITYLRACYMYMFQACTGLTTSPVIKTNSGSQSSSQQAFNYMFSGCTSLSQITCLITGTSTTGTATNNYFYRWALGVPATGTFYRYPEQEWATGNSGVPTGWTLTNYPDIVQADNG